VADFGFARDVITSKIYERKSEGKLPIRWDLFIEPPVFRNIKK